MIDARDFYQNLPVLVTERLVLRPYTMADTPDIFVYASDPAVTQFLFWGPYMEIRQAEDYVRSVLRDYETGKDGPWGIEFREDGRLIGSIHLMDMDAKHRKAEVGFVLASAYHNRGIMTEALSAVLAFALGELGLNRVEGFCDVANLASEAVMRKAGMIREGRLREFLTHKGAVRDFFVYSMLARDFKEKK